ncbi:hypothetical protein HY633_00645 [Candidatus Uhrbacteria bacterium]|nr:hypothetical protein [Candidatus Uhrbacteria bacterium]
MEPALPPFHPKLPELLAHLKLRPLDAIKWNLLACAPTGADKGEATVVLKFGSEPRKTKSIEYEIRILRDVLPTLDRDEFERLVLPEYIDDGMFEEVRWMTSRYISGQPLVYGWSESAHKPEAWGGRGIDVATAGMAVDVLRDLRSVDIHTLPEFVRRFDFARWGPEFSMKAETMIAKGYLERSTVSTAMKLLSSAAARSYEGSMFTNGDFYPRNFILAADGRIAVVDWVGGIDPWEFVAMYAWMLMWGNPQWQIAYLRSIVEHFPVDVRQMRIGLLVRSFEQAFFWRDADEEHLGPARNQMLAYFHEALDEEYVRDLFA